eukprot:SAG22_NODE_5840_length_945_cov_0.920804_1_plen_291_part_10
MAYRELEAEIDDLGREVERLTEIERDHEELKEKVEELTGSCYIDDQLRELENSGDLRELQNSHEDLDRIRSAMSEYLDEADLEHLINEIIPKWKEGQHELVLLRQKMEYHQVEWIRPLCDIRSAMSKHLDGADLSYLIGTVIPKWKGQQPPAEPQSSQETTESSQETTESSQETTESSQETTESSQETTESSQESDGPDVLRKGYYVLEDEWTDTWQEQSTRYFKDRAAAVAYYVRVVEKPDGVQEERKKHSGYDGSGYVVSLILAHEICTDPGMSEHQALLNGGFDSIAE